jgi:DNA-binding transcriptional LysR family regulator
VREVSEAREVGDATRVYDAVTLDQLRTLVAVVEEGSFSAAARKLHRVQSAVSAQMANLEEHLGVQVWDRSSRVPVLTERGQAILAAASRVLAEMDGLRKLTAGLVAGVEARVSLCVDALCPVSVLVDVARDFTRAFPSVDLRVDTQTMSAVSARVVAGTATLGVVSPLGVDPRLERRVLARVRMVPVVSARHPLARARSRGGIPTAAFADHVQIVLSEREGEDDGAPDQAVLSPRTWRVTDLATKHAMLRAGLGWGNLPEHLVRKDLAAKRLVAIRPEAWAASEHTLHLSAVHRRDTMLGPAHTWLLAALEQSCLREVHERRPRAHLQK